MPTLIKNISELLEDMNLSKFQMNPHFHILKFEDHIGVIPMKTESRRCDFFQVVISKNYNVDIIVDEHRFNAFDDSITFLSPNQVVSNEVKEMDDSSTGYMLAFTPEFLKLSPTAFGIYQNFPFFNINNSPVYFLKDNHQDLFFNYMEKIYAYFQEYDNNNIEIIHSYFTILLIEAKKAFFNGVINNSFSSRVHEIAFRFESLVKKTEVKRQKLSYYADKLNISTVYLSQCIKQATHKSAQKVLAEYVLLEAKTILTHSTDTVERIAFRLGFPDSTNFVHFFKKNTGYTPNQFRKLLEQ